MYPLSFGFRLVELYQAYGDLPRRDLRCKIPTEPSWTDRELFMHMCDEDLWLDAKLPDVLLYVARNKHLNIPPSWESCMVDYINHVKREVTRLNYIIIYIYISRLEQLISPSILGGVQSDAFLLLPQKRSPSKVESSSHHFKCLYVLWVHLR